MEERKIARSEGLTSVVTEGKVHVVKPISSVNTLDFLQKYKNAKPRSETVVSHSEDEERSQLFGKKGFKAKQSSDYERLDE